jgi:hypothetical protein
VVDGEQQQIPDPGPAQAEEGHRVVVTAGHQHEPQVGEGGPELDQPVLHPLQTGQVHQGHRDGPLPDHPEQPGQEGLRTRAWPGSERPRPSLSFRSRLKRARKDMDLRKRYTLWYK